ncbi:MAG: ornithine cyclodeaminase family protein [Chloroflexi bacterium]|nr:ornithine cyclodeaminase family protein [Chloroflexota bacterium]
MALFLKESDVRYLLSMEDAIQAVEEAMRDQARGLAANEPRRRVHTSGTSLHMMPAAEPEAGVMGFKTYAVAGGKATVYVFIFSTETSELLAIMEGSRLGQMRTGAASGVATKYMAREDAHRVGIVGTGYQARTQLAAVCAVRTIRQVKAYGRDRERREAFCAETGEYLGVEAVPAASAEEAVADADIIITSTTAREPVLFGDWLRPGMHLNIIGSNSLLKREIDDGVIRKSDIVVVDSREQTRIESGDLLSPLEKGIIHWEQLRELSDVVAGLTPGRMAPSDITMFKSHGIALWDMAAAARVLALAKERGIGEALPM